MKKLVEFLKDHDSDTYYHSFRVADLSFKIAKTMELTENEQQITYYAGLLHDIGKLRVKKEILAKPAKLTQDEWSCIQQHPIYGHEILNKYPLLDNEIKYVVLLHHERSNGSGYPFKLREIEIPLKAKIVAIADTFDAMTNNRVYSRAKTVNEALSIIKSENGSLFDPVVIEALDRLMDVKV